MPENISVKVIDLTGTVEPLKASQLARLIGYEDKHALSTIVGRARDVLSLLVKALNHVLSCHPGKEEKDLRMKIAQIILGGADDDAR